MKNLVLFLTILWGALTFNSPVWAGGDGVFPLQLQEGHWQTFSGHYSVQFHKMADDENVLEVVLFGWNKREPIAWGHASQKLRGNFLSIDLVDRQGGVWWGLLYSGGVGLHILISDGTRDLKLDLIDKNILPHN